MINKNVKIEEVLRLAKEKISQFDTIIDLFNMTFIYISEESARLSGYTSKEMTDKHISNFMTTPEETEEFRQIINKTKENKTVVIPIKTKTGKKLNIKMSFKTIEVKNFPFLVTKAVN